MSVIARLLIGLPLAVVLSVIGMATASATSVFFGVAALPTLLLLLMIGAGIVAGIGRGAAVFRVDSAPSWPVLLAFGCGFCLVSRAGAWAGFEIGEKTTAIQGSNCVGVCGYLFKLRTYMALGATVVSNAIALALNVGHEVRAAGWAWSHHRTGGAAVGTPGEADGALRGIF